MGAMVRALVLSAVLVGHLGLTRAENRNLTFADAISLALAHNTDLYLARVDTELADDDVAIARSIFDRHFVLNTRYGRENQLGSATRFGWTDSLTAGSLELRGLTTSGTTYSVGVFSTYDRYISQFQTIYAPTYSTSFNLTVTQPLLRNAWNKATTAPIVVASLRRDLSAQQLTVKLEQIVGEVETAYWNLALAHNEVSAHESLLKVAKEQVNESTRLVKIGTISDLDLVEAQSGVNREQQAVLLSRQQIIDGEDRLRALIVGGPDWALEDVLIPTDDPTVTPTKISMQEHLELAKKNRPDLLAVRGQVAAARAGLDVTANDLKPQLDVVLNANLIGFAGEPDLSTGVIGTGGFTGNPEAVGGYAKSVTNLVSAGNYAVTLGLRLDLPLGNSAALARHERQLNEVDRVKLAEHAVVVQFENDIRTSVALLDSNAALQQSADDTVKTDERLLAGMRKRFAAGTVSSYDVLRVADELTRAQIGAARARVNYRLSLARLAIADGTLLQKYKISTTSLAAQ